MSSALIADDAGNTVDLANPNIVGVWGNARFPGQSGLILASGAVFELEMDIAVLLPAFTAARP